MYFFHSYFWICVWIVKYSLLAWSAQLHKKDRERLSEDYVWPCRDSTQLWVGSWHPEAKELNLGLSALPLSPRGVQRCRGSLTYTDTPWHQNYKKRTVLEGNRKKISPTAKVKWRIWLDYGDRHVKQRNRAIPVQPKFVLSALMSHVSIIHSLEENWYKQQASSCEQT